MPKDAIHEMLELIRIYNLKDASLKRAQRLAEHGLLNDTLGRFYLRQAHDAVKRAKRTPNYLPEPASAEELGQFGIELGELQENPGVRIGLRHDSRSRHILISGATGFGKSNTIRGIIAGIHKANEFASDPTLVVVMDAKGDYSDLPDLLGHDRFAHHSVHDEFRLGSQPPGDLVPPGLWATQVAKTLAATCGLIKAVSPLATIIRTAFDTMNARPRNKPLWPSLHLIREIVKKTTNSVGGKAEYMRSLRTSLDYLLDNSGNLFRTCRGWDAWEDVVVPRRSAVIDMTLMEPQAYAVVAELIMAQLLLPRIYQRLTKAPPVMVVIDEADYLCSERLGASYPEGYSCSGLLAKQGRGFQVSGCFSVSLLGRVSDFITNNSTYFFTYMQPNYQALAEAAKTLLMRPEGAPLLGSLPTGVCVYRDAQGPCSFPMLARMDLNPGSDMRRPDHFDQHPFVPDMPLSELPDVLEALRTTAVTQNREQRDDAREEQLAQHDLPDLSRKLLDLASVYPFMPVGRLWGKLGDVSPETKVQARKRLELERLAEFVVARCGSHSRQLMFPTEKGWQLLGKNQPSGLGKGKLPHRSFCHWLRDWHVGQGHKVDLEWLVPGTQHSADLAYTVNGVTHCIEVIVDCVENITSHLQACFVKSSAVASVTIVVAQKAMLKGIQAKVASETSLFEYMSRIRFDVIDPYVPKE